MYSVPLHLNPNTASGRGATDRKHIQWHVHILKALPPTLWYMYTYVRTYLHLYTLFIHVSNVYIHVFSITLFHSALLELTRILWSRAVAVGLPVIQRVMRCRLNCLWVRSRLSTLAVKSAVCKCRGSAPSYRASSCILVAVSWSPSSMMDFMMRPAAFTMAKDGCWNSLNSVRPRPATISRTMSNFSASVVSLQKMK